MQICEMRSEGERKLRKTMSFFFLSPRLSHGLNFYLSKKNCHFKVLSVICCSFLNFDWLDTMAHKGRCKQKTIAANKKDALQTKNDGCKQKRCAANKKDALQTKKMRCKQKTIAANKKDALRTKNAVTIWPVTGQGFQNTKWPAVRYFQ